MLIGSVIGSDVAFESVKEECDFCGSIENVEEIGTVTICFECAVKIDERKYIYE